GPVPTGLTTDGNFIWTANLGGSVSRVDPGNGDVTTFTTGFNQPTGILYDGSHVWVTEYNPGKLHKLNPDGTIEQTVAVGNGVWNPIFDGANIWVPSLLANSVTVVRAATGTVLATLTGNGLNGPYTAAFDGERILVTNNGDSVSLWKAASLTPLGSFNAGTDSVPLGACSDGTNFWITLSL